MSEEFTDDQVFSFTGTVKSYNVGLGCGIIIRHDNGEEVGFTRIVLIGDGINALSAGDRVWFELSQDGAHVVRIARITRSQ